MALSVWVGREAEGEEEESAPNVLLRFSAILKSFQQNGEARILCRPSLLRPISNRQLYSCEIDFEPWSSADLKIS